MALWQIVFDPDLVRHSQTSCMIFKWMLYEQYTAGASLMEALEAVNHALLSDISFQLNGGDLRRKDSKMRKRPLDLYIITTAAKRDRNEWEGDMAPYLITTNPDISIYLHTVVVDSWNNIQKYTAVQNAFLSSMKTESQDMENGSSHSSPSPTHEKTIYGSFVQMLKRSLIKALYSRCE